MEKPRRLSDKIIAAHRQACDQGNLKVAELLLNALEIEMSGIGGEKRENRYSMDHLEEAFKRHDRMLREI